MDYAQAEAPKTQSEAAYILAALDRAIYLTERCSRIHDIALGERPQQATDTASTLSGSASKQLPIGTLRELYQMADRLNAHVDRALGDLEAVYDALNIRN